MRKLLIALVVLGGCRTDVPTRYTHVLVGPGTFDDVTAACAALGGTMATYHDPSSLGAIESACATSTDPLPTCWTGVPVERDGEEPMTLLVAADQPFFYAVNVASGTTLPGVCEVAR